MLFVYCCVFLYATHISRTHAKNFNFLAALPEISWKLTEIYEKILIFSRKLHGRSWTFHRRLRTLTDALRMLKGFCGKKFEFSHRHITVTHEQIWIFSLTHHGHSRTNFDFLTEKFWFFHKLLTDISPMLKNTFWTLRALTDKFLFS